jgi:hypothetical protein
MAVITISNTGGNFNSTGTWVGGVVPLTTDTINATATSGPLTITDVRIVASADFTNYTSTLTINNTLTTGGAVVISPTMTITGSSTFIFSGTQTINSVSSVRIPRVQFTGINTTKTITGILKCTDFIKIAQNLTSNGGTVSITNWITTQQTGQGRLFGTSVLSFDDDVCNWISGAYDVAVMNNPIVINTPGTFSIIGSQSYSGMINISYSGSRFTHIQGAITGDRNLRINPGSGGGTTNNTTSTLDLASFGTWSSIYIMDGGTGNNNFHQITLNSDLKFNELFFSTSANPTDQSYGGNLNRNIIRFTGPGRLKGGYITSGTALSNAPFIGAAPINPNNIVYLRPRIQLTPGTPSHTLTGIRVSGMSYNYGTTASSAIIQSATAGTPAFINVSDGGYTINVDYRDINASGGSVINNYLGSQQNCINIATASFGGGSSESSFTFVN